MPSYDITLDQWVTPYDTNTHLKTMDAALLDRIAKRISDRLADDDPLGLIDPFLFADELDAEIKRLANKGKQNEQQ